MASRVGLVLRKDLSCSLSDHVVQVDLPKGEV